MLKRKCICDRKGLRKRYSSSNTGPDNILFNSRLAAANFFLGVVGMVQLGRIGIYESSKKEGVAEIVDDVKKEVKEEVKEVKA